jgi:hypothetical protein
MIREDRKETALQSGDNQALRWAARKGEPVPFNLYRVMRWVEQLTPDQLERVADGMDALMELREAAGVTGMSTHRALDSGLLTEADVWGAFGMAPPMRDPA